MSNRATEQQSNRATEPVEKVLSRRAFFNQFLVVSAALTSVLQIGCSRSPTEIPTSELNHLKKVGSKGLVVFNPDQLKQISNLISDLRINDKDLFKHKTQDSGEGDWKITYDAGTARIVCVDEKAFLKEIENDAKVREEYEKKGEIYIELYDIHELAIRKESVINNNEHRDYLVIETGLALRRSSNFASTKMVVNIETGVVAEFKYEYLTKSGSFIVTGSEGLVIVSHQEGEKDANIKEATKIWKDLFLEKWLPLITKMWEEADLKKRTLK